MYVSVDPLILSMLHVKHPMAPYLKKHRQSINYFLDDFEDLLQKLILQYVYITCQRSLWIGNQATHLEEILDRSLF